MPYTWLVNDLISLNAPVYFSEWLHFPELKKMVDVLGALVTITSFPSAPTSEWSKWFFI